MTNFLDKLAMEVAEWSAVGFHKAGLKNNDYEMLADPHLEDQWLQRRKELINEPDDADAPEWANWKAQDSCGKWSWYEEKPIVGESMWMEDEWQGSNNGKIPAGHDWRTTLKEVKRDSMPKHIMEALAEHSPCSSEIVDGCADLLPYNQTLEAQLYAVRELALTVDVVDDHTVSLMLKKAIKQILERELDIDFSYDKETDAPD